MSRDEFSLYFDAFREIIKAVHSTLDIKEVLNILVNEVGRVMKLKGCAIRLLDPNRRTLELVSSYGLSEKYLQKGPVEVDRSISEAMEGKTVIVFNVREDSRAQYKKEAAEEGIYSIISVPLSLKGRVIGVMRLYTVESRNLVEDEIKFIESLAEMGAIAIENARMYERTRKDYEDIMRDIYTFIGYRRSI